MSMKKQDLKPETLSGLKALCIGAQYNNFVQCGRAGAAYQMQEYGRRVLVLIGDKGAWAESVADLSKGRLFVYWG
jgi:hypothetical protein